MTVGSAFVYFFCVLVPFVLLEHHPRFRRERRGPMKHGHLATAAAIGLLLFPLTWTLLPTRWGKPVDAIVLVADGEARIAVTSYRSSTKGDDWCAVRTFALDGRELDHSLWTTRGGCTPLAERSGRVRWYGADAGVFAYERGVAVVDLWTGAEPFMVDDVLASAALPGDGDVRVRGVDADHLVLELQDGSRRFLSPTGDLVDAPGPAGAGIVVSLEEPGREVEQLGSVFKVRKLGCGGLVLYRELAFGDEDDRIGCLAGADESVVTECGSRLGIEPPVVGTLRVDDVCWVLGESLVGIDAQGRTTTTIPL
jgi:hypothetical protein